MQMNEAAKLRVKWGNKPCSHPNIDKEFYEGSPTGDYVCTQCGEVGHGKHWASKQSKD
uniref:Uncharacterized protein n=2 Tax=Vibrio TaxID=662 RepID=A0A0H3ZJP0_9VIBR|nr:hypothetical protein [Vibrio tasmaniensis]AKN40821.1 hypothetical protein [Vibrio sp. 1F_189]